MKMLLLIFFILSGFISFSQKNISKDLTKRRLQLKNYAFCSCIYNVDTTKRQTMVDDGSMSGYFEISDYEFEAYNILDILAKKYASKKYSSKFNKPLGLMKCLDFYNSK